MTTGQELEVQQKREVAQAEESTQAARYFVPPCDIHETDDALVISMEMPGVSKENVEKLVHRRGYAPVSRLPVTRWGVSPSAHPGRRRTSRRPSQSRCAARCAAARRGGGAPSRR